MNRRDVLKTVEFGLPVTMLGRIPADTLFYPESFREELAPLLSITPDAVTGVPYCKQQDVSVERIPLTPTLSPETGARDMAGEGEGNMMAAGTE